MNPFERWNLSISAGAVATSFVVASPSFAFGLAIGAALEVVNFGGLLRSAQLLFHVAIPGQRIWSVVFALRFSLLAVGIFAALHFGVNAVGLLVGLSLVVPAVILEAWRTRPAILDDAPALDSDDPIWDRWDPWLAREVETDEEFEEESG